MPFVFPYFVLLLPRVLAVHILKEDLETEKQSPQLTWQVPDKSYHQVSDKAERVTLTKDLKVTDNVKMFTGTRVVHEVFSCFLR